MQRSPASHAHLGPDPPTMPAWTVAKPVDLVVGAGPPRATPDVAMRENAHGREHMRGAERARVKAEPLDTEKPSASSAVTSASPSTYRQEKVRTCGSRSSGSPTTSTSVMSPPRPVAQLVDPRPVLLIELVSLLEPAWRAAAAGQCGRDVRVTGGESVLPLIHGPARRQRVPFRTASSPTPPGRPTCARWRSTRTSRPVLRHARSRRPRRRRAAPARAAHTSASSAIGWRVPTSWLADWSAATATPGCRTCAAKASRSTRPRLSTATSCAVPAAAAAWSTAECSTAECTTTSPIRRRAAVTASNPEWIAAVPGGAEEQLVHQYSEAFGQHRTGVVELQVWRSVLVVEPGGSAHPDSNAESNTSRAAGCRGSAVAASRYARLLTSETLSPTMRRTAGGVQ